MTFADGLYIGYILYRGFKGFDLNNWKDNVAVVWNNTHYGRSNFGCITCELPIKYPRWDVQHAIGYGGHKNESLDFRRRFCIGK